MPLITPRTFRGTRDFLPSELLGRRRILEVIEEAYRRYGFQPLETPAIEYLDILTGKSEENDKLIYEIKRARGDEEETAESAIALRYDLTVPLARVVAQYAGELPRPFKRYQIQPVWRADRPQPRQGRFREFVQCDADIVGTESLLADAEIVALTYEVLRDLGFEQFHIRLSSRKFLKGLVVAATGDPEKFSSFCRAIDKLDKIGWDGVAAELEQSGIPAATAQEVLRKVEAAFAASDFAEALGYLQGNADGEAGVKEIEAVFHQAINLGVPQTFIKCDPFLARGLDYYTGPIFESVSTELPHLGSLSGGGRYDGLVGTFSKENFPAVGTTIGLDRIQTALTQLNKFKTQPSTTQVLVSRFDADGVSEGLKIAAELRQAGVRVEIWYDNDKMKKQFAFADKQGIPLVIIAGPDERAENMAAVKNLKTTEQKKVARAALVETVQALLRDLQ
ncbi:MAG TPA: histidine--tRNA ligase [bacterium]